MRVGPYGGSIARIVGPWLPVCSFTESPTRIYFNQSSEGVHLLAAERPMSHPETPLLDSASPPRPETYPLKSCFHSEAALENVVQVTVCRSLRGGNWHIDGLLFRYSNGDRASVGQFRMDHAGTPLETDNSQNLHLGFGEGGIHTRPYVARIELGSPNEIGSLHWLCLPWMGKLKWWFTYNQCQVHHDRQASPPMRL